MFYMMWTRSALSSSVVWLVGPPDCPSCEDLWNKGKLALNCSFLLEYYFQIFGLKQICLL